VHFSSADRAPAGRRSRAVHRRRDSFEEITDMRILRFTPALLLVLAASGCGVDRITSPLAPQGASPANAALAAARAAAGLDGSGAGAAGRGSAGTVYTISNAAAGNAVVSWRRGPDGSLSDATSTPTGGLGTDASLGDQGAILADAEDGLVFAVDAGSNDVAMLRATPQGVRLLGRSPSGGEHPISLTRHGSLLFVLNAGGDGNVAGFRIRPDGRLAAIPGATRGLGGGATGPAQVGFSPDGNHLVVTEKAANALAVYDVAPNGALSGPHVQPSPGATPYGFAFTRSGTLVVSEAAGGAAGASSASSYRFAPGGGLVTVSAAVPTHQSSACWVAAPRTGDFAYTSNAASSTLSGYRVNADGSIALIDPAGDTAHTDGGALDTAFDESGRFLYVLNGGTHTLNAYRRMADGHLDPMPGVSGLPATSAGLAAI
jgi:6-phosphogluconolactonase